MTIEISKQSHKAAIESIERYFVENGDEPIGNIAADGLLRFFLAEIAPAVYNQAVATVQANLQARIAEIDIDIHEEEFSYWRKSERSRKRN